MYLKSGAALESVFEFLCFHAGFPQCKTNLASERAPLFEVTSDPRVKMHGGGT